MNESVERLTYARIRVQSPSSPPRSRGANEPMMCSLGKTKGYSPPSSPPPSCCNLLDYVRLCFRQGLRTDGRTDGRGRRTDRATCALRSFGSVPLKEILLAALLFSLSLSIGCLPDHSNSLRHNIAPNYL